MRVPCHLPVSISIEILTQDKSLTSVISLILIIKKELLLLVYIVDFGLLKPYKPLWGVPLIISVIWNKLKKIILKLKKNFKKNFSNASRHRKN